MKQRNSQNHTDLAGSKMSAAQKKKVRMTNAQRKAARKAAKEAILPVHKRPVVCPRIRPGEAYCSAQADSSVGHWSFGWLPPAW